MRVGITSVVVYKAAFCHSDGQLKTEFLSPFQVLAESFLCLSLAVGYSQGGREEEQET